jgi:hypothetical protein
MHFLDIITHLVALDKTIGIIFSVLNEFDFISQTFEIIMNFCFGVLKVKRSIEFDHYRRTASNTRFYISLYVYNRFPVFMGSPPLECLHEAMVCNNT